MPVPELREFEYIWTDSKQAVLDQQRWGAEKLVPLSRFLGQTEIRETHDMMMFDKSLAPNLEGVLAFMRFSQVLGNILAAEKQIKHTFGINPDRRAKDYSHFLLRDGTVVATRENSVAEHRSMLYDYGFSRLEMIMSCRSNGSSCRNKFEHVVTDRGICSAINSIDQRAVFRELRYLGMMSQVYTMPDRTHPSLSMRSGISGKISLILDIHRTDVFGSESGHFELAVSNFWEAFSLTRSIQMFVGQQVTLYVRSFQVMDENSVRSFFPPEKRSCLFADESISQMFWNYSKAGCVFECQLQAARINASCIPWDQFHSDAEASTFPICTRDRTTAFQVSPCVNCADTGA